MGLFDQFPYTNTHELNLDWIMQSMKELLVAYDSLQTDIKEIQDFISNFENWFNENVDKMIDDRIEITMAYYLQRINEVEALIKSLEEEINSDGGVLSQVAEIRDGLQSLQTEIFNLKMYYEDRFNSLIELMHEYKNSMDGYVDSKAEQLEQYIKDEVTKLDRLDVINPITGAFESIQNVLNDLADVVTNSYGLTAAQYDALQLTAHVYDSYRITAYDYTTKGYFELYLKLTQNLMRSPFTGDLDTYENIIYSLSNLHKCSLTAQEYDERQITAENFDRMTLTAFMYDWFGYQTLKFITAELYDSLQLTAAVYDEKQITAGQYEEGMQWLSDMSLNCNSSCNNMWILANQIQELTKQIENVQTEVNNIPRPLTTGNGISYVGKVLEGTTLTRTTIPELQDDSVVIVFSEDKNVLPIKIARYGNIVETTWPDTVKDMLFTVTVQNK